MAISVEGSSSYSSCSNQFTQTGDDYKHTLCQYSCSDAGDLKRHLALMTHSQDKSYKRSSCPYTTGRFGNLKRHRTTHSGDNCYKCNACSYSSGRPDILKHLMSTHSADKPFKRAECPYSSRRLGHLRAHLAHKWALCSYSTNHSCNLKSHMSTHERKPSGCDCASAAKRTLVKHILTRHAGHRL